ncbi:MAG TPA: phage holin family protein [Gaiellaceae bacterium]|nr:phage holin family protein [Gaiellaceae bacterium]
MPDGDGSHRVGAAARDVAEHAGALTRLELELAALELKRKARALALGFGLGAAAIVFVVLGTGFALATAVAAIALVTPVWLALLIVTGALFLLAGIAGALAAGRLRRGASPVPKEAIREARLTSEAIKR